MAKCKRCGVKTKLPQEEIDKMVSRITSMKGVRLVDDETYNFRINKCFECEKFEYGSTCMLCGCVMQVRARLMDGRCPYPGKTKWQEGLGSD